jgi:hypothetical protein
MAGLTVPIGRSGVVLGRDQAGAPVQVGLFGPRPVSVAFVGGWWAAQILVHRCLAHGATVLVDAPDVTAPAVPTMAGRADWLALQRMSVMAGAAARVRPMSGDPALGWGATAGQPLLMVHDVGPAGPAHRPPAQPWQTQLTVLARLSPESLRVIAAVDLVLIQRLEAPEASLVAAALLLGPESVARLSTIDNETVVAVRRTEIRYAWLTPTALERQAFG